jgi:Right handed beta helix region
MKRPPIRPRAGHPQSETVKRTFHGRRVHCVTFAILAILGTVGWRTRHITARGSGTLALLTILLVLLPVEAELGTPQASVPETGPLVIENQTGITIRNRRIHNPTGPCVTIHRSSSVLIEGLEIGPCAGNGIAVTESHDVTIASSRISTQRSGRAGRDSGLGIHILTSSNVVVRGSHFVANESGVYAVRSRAIRVLGNYFVGPLGPYPRGQHAQLGYVSGGEVTGNYGVAAATNLPIGMEAHQEDAINIYRSTAISVARNYLVGGNSSSGCGIIVEGRESADNVVEENILVRTGNCGIGIGNGVRNIVRANKVLDTNIPRGSGNVGIYVAHMLSKAQRQARAHGENVRQEATCSDNVVVGNVVSNQLPAGHSNDIYTPNTCARTVREGNLTGTAARVNLLPEAERLPPPPVPPLPHAP